MSNGIPVLNAICEIDSQGVIVVGHAGGPFRLETEQGVNVPDEITYGFIIAEYEHIPGLPEKYLQSQRMERIPCPLFSGRI